MRTLRCFAPACLVSLLPVVGLAQEGTTPAVSTDRPSVAAGTDLVPAFWVTVENGLSAHLSRKLSSIDGSESLVRFGLGHGLELRWGQPVLTRTSSSNQVVRGDGSLTAKVHVPSFKALPCAAIAGSSVPLATHGQGSGAWDPTLLLTCAHPWTPRIFSIATYNFYWTSSPTGPRVRSQQSAFELGVNTSKTATAYVEAAPLASSDKTQAGYIADAGYLWMHNSTTQWDVRMGFTRVGTVRQFIGGAGFSFMFPSQLQHIAHPKRPASGRLQSLAKIN